MDIVNSQEKEENEVEGKGWQRKKDEQEKEIGNSRGT